MDIAQLVLRVWHRFTGSRLVVWKLVKRQLHYGMVPGRFHSPGHVALCVYCKYACVFLGVVLMMQQALACPTVFPTGVTIHSTRAAAGYVIYSSVNAAYAVDILGNVVKSWKSPVAGMRLRYTSPLANGNLLARLLDTKTSPHRDAIVEFDQTGQLVWSFYAPPNLEFHHDHERMANGNTVIPCTRSLSRPSISWRVLRDNCFLEVSHDGNIVWDWQTADHFEELDLSAEEKERIFADGGDWAHMNAVFPIPPNTSHTDPRFKPGNVLISYRKINTMAIVDRDTKRIVWQLRNITMGQHNAYMLSDEVPGSGNILVFDNGHNPNGQLASTNRAFSRVLEINPTNNAVIYSYNATDSRLPQLSFFSSKISGAQRLSNGNTLIVEGGSGRIFEVTRRGEIVWEYINPFHDAQQDRQVYRAVKMPLQWLNVTNGTDSP